MTQKPDNSQVLPQMNWVMQFDGGNNTVKPSHPFINGGMTLRDYFAARCPESEMEFFPASAIKDMLGISDLMRPLTNDEVMQGRCMVRYKYANAMLEEREATHD